MENIKNSLKIFNYKLFGTLLLISLLPILYTTLRIFFLGDIPNDWGFNIASQLAWVNVIYEVIQEAMILPLFYLIGKSLNNTEDLENKIKTGLIFSFTIYFIFSVIIFILAKPLLIFMSQKENIIDISVKYIRIETIAILISILYKFLSIIFISMNKNKSLLILLFIQMIFTMICDFFLISGFSFSLKIGVVGIAITNIIVNTILFITGVYLLRRDNIKIISKNKLSFNWLKEWIKIGSISGLESFIRNFAFIIMILKMINLVQEQGNFWVANNFIWGWLLLPVMSLGELIKRNTGEKPEKLNQSLPSYFIITSIIILFWLVTIPFWNMFINKVMNIKESFIIFHIVIISIGFYTIFAYNNVIDSIFYGLGRTDLMLIQSVVINSLFYGTLFILFKLGIFTPTLNKIAIMFGAGMALDSLLTFIMFWYLKRNNLLKNAIGQIV
ncbi:MAG: multidrug efflux protein [Bacteroidetes bacterium ADurb.Bin028]|nr:MAG: multidrug efflux protein [Bacteroidetes bacterium ADurb.Bin028]